MKRFLTPIVLCLSLFLVSSCEEKVSESIALQPKGEIESRFSGQVLCTVVAEGVSWTASLDFGENADQWALLSKTEGSGTATLILSYTANGDEKARSLTLTVATPSGKTASKTYTQPGTGAPTRPMGVLPEWLELPAPKEGLTFYTHSFTFQNRLQRNYSIGWDKSNKVSHWVAYPLCKDHLNGVGRGDRWDMWCDPEVPADEQLDLSRGFPSKGVPGYDRGHQIPSADRRCNSEAEAQTYFSTNMTPQLSAFNQKTWANFEGQVRSWAEKVDTLYVVTGCTVDGKTFAGSTGMAIPSGYFKVLLSYSPSSTLGTWSSMAFYFDHKDYTSVKNYNLKNQAMSVNELEEKLGFDFFPNLARKVGQANAEKIEGVKPSDNNTIWF